ncbi:MAG: DUF4157 domain-containing protein [Wenzhouxiangellaceae bacterium]
MPNLRIRAAGLTSHTGKHVSRHSHRSHRQPAGNQATQRHFQRISQPHDAIERRAGQTAYQVMNGTGAINPQARQTGSRQIAGGQPLPQNVRRWFEPRFQQDFSAVRIHDNSTAHQSAAAINARAFTVGSHITFDKGQYAPHTMAGRRLLAHELAHVSQPDSDPNTAYRETWDVDDSARTVERGVLVQLIFKNTWSDSWNNTGWTSSRKNTFRNNFESSIENTFNNSNTVLNPPATASDVLPADNISKGYKPKVDISLVPDGDYSTGEDWEVDVESNPGKGYRQSSSNTMYGELHEGSNESFTKKNSAPGVTQIPTAHEFGHYIGLDHPGKGLEGGWFSDSQLSSGADEYSHTGKDQHGRAVDGPNDLMGGGMGLQPFYFDAWSEKLDEHIEDLRKVASRRRFNSEMRTFKKAIGGDPASVGWFMRGLGGT